MPTLDPTARVYLAYNTSGYASSANYWVEFHEYEVENRLNRTAANPGGSFDSGEPSHPWYDCYQGGQIIMGTMPDVASVIRQFTSLHGQNAHLDSWHQDNLPAGVSWSGRYFVVKSLASRWRTAEYNAEGMPVMYDCWHCAEVRARELRQSGITYAVMSMPAETASLRMYLPPVPETIGAALGSDTGTTTKPTRERGFSSCRKCLGVGHNTRTCTRSETHIDRVGIEIEGRWRNLDTVEQLARRAGMTGCGDGSVRGSSTARPWEFQTVPGTPAQALNQLHEFYPDEADASCGMHVHVSFKHNTAVTLLYTQGFFDYFRARWEAWGSKINLHPRGEFFSRLYGYNDYCRPNIFSADTSRSRQRSSSVLCNPDSYTENDRYAQLNFLAWNEHKTVECRLLPMFQNAALAYSAVQELLDIYETWLTQGAATISLPSTKCGAGAQPGAVKHHVALAAPDCTPLVMGLTSALPIAELPPVEPGSIRRMLSPEDRERLQNILRLPLVA